MALKRIKNVSPRHGAREIEHPPGRWITVEYGGHVDLPTGLAASLAEQADVWEVVDMKAAAAALTEEDR